MGSEGTNQGEIMPSTDKPRFTCGYAGVCDYQWRGRKYRVRSSAADRYPGDGWNYTPEDWAAQVVAAVGTIMWDESAHFHEFPPADLAEHFPGYVLARYRDDFTIEYAGDPPQQEHSDIYKATLSLAWANELRKVYADCA